MKPGLIYQKKKKTQEKNTRKKMYLRGEELDWHLQSSDNRNTDTEQQELQSSVNSPLQSLRCCSLTISSVSSGVSCHQQMKFCEQSSSFCAVFPEKIVVTVP